MDKAELIWQNGEFVDWDDAQVHVLSHGLHYGTGVFEGIRAYDTEHGTAVFRMREHLDRLAKSAQLYFMELPFSGDALREATHELIRRNQLRSCYIRPLAFRGYGEMGLYAQSAPIEVMIAVWSWGAYLGEDGKKNGIRAKVSSWRALSGESLIPHAKASGQYLNSILAKTESAKAGYDEAILLDDSGNVSEGSGENIFLVREGKLITPGHTSAILDGITRRSVIQIAGDLGYRSRSATSPAPSSIWPTRSSSPAPRPSSFRSARSTTIPLAGPARSPGTSRSKFEDALHGRADEYREWLDVVEQPSKVTG